MSLFVAFKIITKQGEVDTFFVHKMRDSDKFTSLAHI